MPDRRNLNTEVELLNQIFNSDGTLSLEKAYVQSGTSFPLSPLAGQLFYLTSGSAGLYIYEGGTWNAVGGSGGVTSLDSITGAISLIGGGNIQITDNSPSAGDITISDAIPSSGSGASMAPLTITGQTFSNNKYVLTGSKFFTADQSVVAAANKFLIIKNGIRNAAVGGGGGGGFVIIFTSSAGKQYWVGIDTLSTSHQLFALLDATGSPTFVAGPNLGFRPGVEILTLGFWWEDSAGAFNSLPQVFCRVADTGGGNVKDMAWSPGNISGTWTGKTVSIEFYTDDNATSTISYMGPSFAYRNDPEWF